MLDEDDSDIDIDDVTRGGARRFSRVGRNDPGRRRKALAVGGACAVAAVIASLAVATNGSRHLEGAKTAGLPASPSARSAVINESAGTAGQAPQVSGATSNIPSAAASSAPAVNGLPNEVPALSTKVVKTGTLQLQVASGSIPTTIGRLSSEASGLSGFVASSSESTGTSASGDVTIRVPVANFEVLVGDAQRLGKTVQLTSSGQDVTGQYVDLQARIQSLQSTRTQFEQILAKAQTIADILSVESQISDLQTQIEQLQGQFQVLNDQATYSTLTVQISEAGKPPPAPPKPAGGISKSWSHARHSFAHGAESILAASGGIAVFLVTLAAILLVGRLAWLGIRRRIS